MVIYLYIMLSKKIIHLLKCSILFNKKNDLNETYCDFLNSLNLRSLKEALIVLSASLIQSLACLYDLAFEGQFGNSEIKMFCIIFGAQRIQFFTILILQSEFNKLYLNSNSTWSVIAVILLQKWLLIFKKRPNSPNVLNRSLHLTKIKLLIYILRWVNSLFH